MIRDDSAPHQIRLEHVDNETTAVSCTCRRNRLGGFEPLFLHPNAVDVRDAIHRHRLHVQEAA